MNGKDLELGVRRSAVCGLRSSSGFTLIELLVSMAILMIIVLMLANLFQQSTRAWDAGLRQTQVGLEARALINMIQRELNMAIPSAFFSANGSTLQFTILDADGQEQDIDYQLIGSTISRNRQELVGDVDRFDVSAPPYAEGELPDLVDIDLRMSADSSTAAVRVYAEERSYDSGLDVRDVVDTHRGSLSPPD